MVYLVISSCSLSSCKLLLSLHSVNLLISLHLLCPFPYLFYIFFAPFSLFHFPISQLFRLCFYAALFQISFTPSPSSLPVLLFSLHVPLLFCLYIFLVSMPPPLSILKLAALPCMFLPSLIASSLCLPFLFCPGYLRSSAERCRLPDL